MDRPHLRTSHAATPPHTSPPLSPTVSSSSVSRYSPIHRRTNPPKSQIPSLPRRLLVPTSCPKRVLPSLELQPVKSKSSNRLTRTRADSAPPESTQTEVKDQRRWFNCDSRFEVVEEDVRISGYQIFAVEKWIVERRRATILLTVYTGDPKDIITVTALAPDSSLTHGEAHQEWEKIIHELRKDGARPRETDKGIIMITSLANFRSDYTVVHIPDGDFLAHRQRLYVNINLLRMGCSGRSALTLQEPSDTTKDRFNTMFHFSDAVRAGDRFGHTVIELVRLIQCALSLFDMFPIDFQEQDGLLCDETVNGIQKWISEIGNPYMNIEPTERVADPSTVSALISLVLSMRNKVSAIGYQAIPKDPFLQPRQFTRCLATFVSQRLSQAPSGPNAAPAIIHHVYLNPMLIRLIDSAYDKHRSSEAYKLHRVVLNKIDDLTTATTSAMSSSKDTSHGRSMSLTLSSKDREAENLVGGTSDLATFVNRIEFLHKKDCGASIRYLWTGKLDQLERKRHESLWSDMEEAREKEREKSDSDDEGDARGALPWPNKVTKKLENWAGEFGRNRLKKSSLDLPKDKSRESVRGALAIPSVVVSRENDGIMSGHSSGQASPLSASASYPNLGAFSSGHASALGIDDEEYIQRVAQFNRQRPTLVAPARKRAFSWADQLSAADLLDEVEVDVKAMEATVLPFEIHHDANVFPWTRQPSASAPAASKPPKVKKPRDPFVLRRKRSYSFDDRGFLDPNDILSREHLRTDVDLCIQCLIMQRRKAHIQSVIDILQALVQSSSSNNEMLLKYHQENAVVLKELEEKCQIMAKIEEAVSSADSASADTDALVYEANFLDIAGLWRMAQAPRLRVFAIRDRVFGARNQRRFGLSGNSRGQNVHGRFNRIQKRIDGSERLVDFLGRTESEVEEEADLPEDVHFGSDEDSDEEADMREHAETDGGQEGRFQAMSDWLLTLFTKWGRVLGVGGATPETVTLISESAAPEKDESDHSSDPLDDVGSDEDLYRPTARRPVRPNSGHFHRLSTVGEEDEPPTGPNTPTTSDVQLLSSSR